QPEREGETMNRPDAEDTRAPSRSRDGSLAKRLLASAVFLPCLIVIARFGSWYYFALIELVIVIGLVEYYSIMSTRGLRPHRLLGMAAGALLPAALFLRGGMWAPVLITAFLLAVMTAELIRGEREHALGRIAATVFGVMYVSWLGSHLALVRELPRETGLEYAAGFPLVIAVFTMTWCYDTGAYAAGTLFGRRRLFPSISPGKTVEGAAGGVIFSIAGILVAREIVEMPFTGAQAAALAVAASVTGQVGDLVESLMKRDAGIKDSSRAIPGHGGVLDRFDSLLFTAPVLYYLMRFLVLRGH
ncbi:MAG: phosphatidate cytidylyltransferase, partial [Candidatus Krumholzibacteria bacterium]|nr:phosphatidate cytidylyltransferase [Candidatus Krumholzibacteria bacterium]